MVLVLLLKFSNQLQQQTDFRGVIEFQMIHMQPIFPTLE